MCFFQVETVTIASMLKDATDVLTTGVGTVWTLVTGNPLLCLFVGASVLTLGFSFFRKAKRAAK